MEKPEQSRKGKHCWRRIWRKFFIWMLLVTFLLIVTVLSLSGYAISKYKQDYYGSCLRSCDIMAEEFTEYSRQNPREDLLRDYIPKNMDKIAQQTDAFLYLFNQDGDCIYASENSGISADDLKLSTEMRSGLQKDGEYMTDSNVGKIDHSAAEPMLTRGRTFYLVRNGEEVPYYMFASSYTRQLNVYVTHMMLLVVILFFVMLLLRYVQGDYSQSIDTDSFVGTELEQVASLAEQIGSQSGRAEESSRQFVSNVSHELRTPMTIISGFVEGILDGTVPKPKRMEYLSIVSQEVQRLKMLVTSMLNLTKFDAGTIQMNYRMFTLNDTAFRTILMFENRLEKRNIAVEGLDSPPVRVCADPDLIGQVVYNLVENAVKFVNDGGTITFTFADEENDWVFAVRNTGKGISKEELPKIFERFYKSDASRSQDKTGLGLGLDITKKIIHLHHAQISVRSEENAYTEFEVRLPHMEPPEQENE